MVQEKWTQQADLVAKVKILGHGQSALASVLGFKTFPVIRNIDHQGLIVRNNVSLGKVETKHKNYILTFDVSNKDTIQDLQDQINIIKVYTKDSFRLVKVAPYNLSHQLYPLVYTIHHSKERC